MKDLDVGLLMDGDVEVKVNVISQDTALLRRHHRCGQRCAAVALVCRIVPRTVELHGPVGAPRPERLRASVRHAKGRLRGNEGHLKKAQVNTDYEGNPELASP